MLEHGAAEGGVGEIGASKRAASRQQLPVRQLTPLDCREVAILDGRTGLQKADDGVLRQVGDVTTTALAKNRWRRCAR